MTAAERTWLYNSGMGRSYVDVNPPAPAHWETSTYTYSETIPHAVTSVTRGEEEDTYEYDSNGNMTCRVEDDVTFIRTYNAENRISTVQKLASPAGAGQAPDCETPGDLGRDRWSPISKRNSNARL